MCDCDNCCKDPYVIPQGPEGPQGDPGEKGDPGTDGVCVRAKDGIIHSVYVKQDTPTGTGSNFEFTSLTYSLPINMLENDGDSILIRAAFLRDDITKTTIENMVGSEDVSIYFGSEKITYDFNGVIENNATPWTADIEILLTRINNNDFIAMSTLTLYGKYYTNLGSASYSGFTTRQHYIRKTSTTSYDFTNTAYNIKGIANYTGITTPVTMLHMTIQKISKY